THQGGQLYPGGDKTHNQRQSKGGSDRGDQSNFMRHSLVSYLGSQSESRGISPRSTQSTRPRNGVNAFLTREISVRLHPFSRNLSPGNEPGDLPDGKEIVACDRRLHHPRRPSRLYLFWDECLLPFLRAGVRLESDGNLGCVFAGAG